MSTQERQSVLTPEDGAIPYSELVNKVSELKNKLTRESERNDLLEARLEKVYEIVNGVKAHLGLGHETIARTSDDLNFLYTT